MHEVKYNLEHQLLDKRRILDSVDKVHFREKTTLLAPNEFTSEIDVDLERGNYFVLDLYEKDKIRYLYFNFINIPSTIMRFEILIGRPERRIYFMWENDTNDYEVNFPWEYKVPEMDYGDNWNDISQLISFTKITINNEKIFVAISSEWFKIK